MARKSGPRPGLLLLSIAAPALLAGALTALLVMPERRARLAGSGGRAPSLAPSVDLAPQSRRDAPHDRLGISIPTARVQGPVDPIRTVRGQLEIPPPGRAGWFRAGPRPGEPGRAVIVSHVDSQAGPALFAGLRTLRRRTRILVEDRSGRIHRFRLVRRLQVEKSRFRHDLIYAPSPRPTLVLITCGGPFTPGDGYRDNVILYARAA